MNAAVNAFCDFALAIFPITFLKDLQLQAFKKLVLGCMMSCGIMLVCPIVDLAAADRLCIDAAF